MSDGPEGETATDEAVDDISSLVVRALELSEGLLDDASGDESEASEQLDELQTVVDEASELLEAMDLSELPSAIDGENLDELIVEEDVPEAVANLDPEEAVRLRKLLTVIDMGELWDSVDVRDVWRNKREFEDAVDEFTEDDGDGDDDIPIVSEFTDDDGDDDELDVDMDVGETLSMGGGDDDVDVPDAAYQTAIQSQLSDSVAVFREGLLEVHQELARMREENEARTDAVEQPDSRNPTAQSTLATTRTSNPVITQYSTVPSESKYSGAPNRPRIYGERFKEEVEDDA